ncbi:hypothetical protein DSM100238_1284, partial [Bifidobacterium apri]
DVARCGGGCRGFALSCMSWHAQTAGCRWSVVVFVVFCPVAYVGTCASRQVSVRFPVLSFAAVVVGVVPSRCVCLSMRSLCGVARCGGGCWRFVPLCMSRHAQLVGCRPVWWWLSGVCFVVYVVACADSWMSLVCCGFRRVLSCCVCLGMRNLSDVARCGGGCRGFALSCMSEHA